MLLSAYFDVDGVINTEHPSTPPAWPGGYRTVRVAGDTVTYAMGLISALNEMTDTGLVRFCANTSWTPTDFGELARAIGLNIGPWTMLTGDLHDHSGEYWWKWIAIKEDLAQHPGRFVWVDDDLRHETNAQQWAHESGGLPIAPNPFDGLTPESLRIARRFLGA